MRRLKWTAAAALALGACAQPEEVEPSVNVASVKQAIFGGTAVTDQEYESLRFMVGLSSKNAGTRSGHECGATLIHPRWAITAAHCFAPGTTMNECINTPSRCRATIGVKRLSDALSPNLFDVTGVYMHPNYSATTNVDDIALVKLSGDAPGQPVTLFSDAHATMSCKGFTWPVVDTRCGLHTFYDVQPNTPPFYNSAEGVEWQAMWDQGTPLLAIGWGRTDVSVPGATDYLMRTGIDPLGPKVLQYYGRGREAFEAATGVDDPNMTDGQFVALDPAENADTCNGDSGGPLLVRSGNQWQQLGITSFGLYENNCSGGGVYTYLPKYLSWIQSYVGISKVSGPALTDDSWATRTVWAPGSSGAQPTSPAPNSSEFAAGFSLASTVNGNTSVTESETVVAFDLAQIAGSAAALDQLNVKYAKLKVFVTEPLNGLQRPATRPPGTTGPAGELCLHPNTSTWNRTAALGWTARPTTGTCISKGQFAPTLTLFPEQYLGYTRIKGNDLSTYVTFHIPATSAKDWMRNGFTIRGLANNGFLRFLASSESPYPPELTVVYDCPAGTRDAGSLRCVSATGARVMSPAATAASTANGTPAAGMMRVGGSTTNPERALVKFDIGAIKAQMGTGSIVSATLEVPVASTTGWASQYVGLFRADAPWSAGPVPHALTPGASTLVSSTGGVMKFDVKNDLNLMINGLSLWPAPGVLYFNNYGWVVRKIVESQPGTVNVGASASAPVKLTVVLKP